MRKQQRVFNGKRYDTSENGGTIPAHSIKSLSCYQHRQTFKSSLERSLLRMSKSKLVLAQLLLVLLLAVACATTANAATPAPVSSSSASSDTPVPSTCDQDVSGKPSVQAFATQADSDDTKHQSIAVVLSSVAAVAAAAGIIMAIVVSRRRQREPTIPIRAPKLSPPVTPACELEEIVLTNSTMARCVTPPMSPFSTKMYVYTAQI